MRKNQRRMIALLVAVAAALLACAAARVNSSAQTQQTQTGTTATVKQVSALTPQERRGKAIYLRGESPTGKDVTAMMGEIDVPASTLTCAGCHGLAGEGKTEGGVTAGALTWQHLTKAYGHTHPSGRKHGPFDEASFIRAVTAGIDPQGNTLLVAMPRYRIAPDELADVIAYLKRIETDRDPGLTETTIKVGTVLPGAGALAAAGQAMRDVLVAYFDDLNSKGGIYSRKVELRVAETGTDSAATAANLKRLLTQEQVFSLVGGITAGADREAVALMQAEGTPLVGPSTLSPLSGSLQNRYTFYLLPGFKDQARALVNFAATKPELKKTGVALVYSDAELNAEAAAAVEEQAKKAGWSTITKSVYPRAQFDAAKTVASLRQQGAGAVFLLGTEGTEKAFLQEAARAGWTPTVLLLGAQAGGGFVESVPLAFKEKVFLAFPTIPTDITPAGVAEYRALLEKYKITQRHTASQLSAFAAAKIFVEGLKLAGRDLSREKLVTALEGLYDYETGLTPRITFGPNRRIGAQGAYIVNVNPETKQFVVASGWVAAN
ncbi:MAG TPA: ABC transporter substrate-binding protein [Pyrinomonadaceae bacterium]|nr:ABC transporter substrate-binding protein [Pyrinomonadaceae bacterium]